METKSSSHSRPLRPSYVHPDTASVNRKLDMVESLFGSVPASATLEEARDERLNRSCINLANVFVKSFFIDFPIFFWKKGALN